MNLVSTALPHLYIAFEAAASFRNVENAAGLDGSSYSAPAAILIGYPVLTEMQRDVWSLGTVWRLSSFI